MDFKDFIYELAREFERKDQTAGVGLRKIVRKYDKELQRQALEQHGPSTTRRKPLKSERQQFDDDEIPF